MRACCFLPLQGTRLGGAGCGLGLRCGVGLVYAGAGVGRCWCGGSNRRIGVGGWRGDAACCCRHLLLRGGLVCSGVGGAGCWCSDSGSDKSIGLEGWRRLLADGRRNRRRRQHLRIDGGRGARRVSKMMLIAPGTESGRRHDQKALKYAVDMKQVLWCGLVLECRRALL